MLHLEIGVATTTRFTAFSAHTCGGLGAELSARTLPVLPADPSRLSSLSSIVHRKLQRNVCTLSASATGDVLPSGQPANLSRAL